MADASTNWLFQGPNYIFAAMLYTLMGRYVLSLFFRHNSDLVIWRVFRQVTDPILRAVRAITPAIVPDGLVFVFSIVWLLALRMLWFFIAFVFGFLPRVGG